MSFLFPEPSCAEEPIRIGGTLGLTGKYALFSDMQLKGFRLWEEDVNRRGGILGRPVKVIILDDKSDAKRSVYLYTKLIEEDKVDFLFAPFSSEITGQILPVTERHKYPMLISGASADRLWSQGYEYIFGLFMPAGKLTVGFLELLLMNGVDNVAIVHAGDPFSLDIAEGARKWAGMLGLKIVIYEKFSTKDKSTIPVLAEKIISRNANAVLVCGFLNEFVSMSEALYLDGEYNGLFYTPIGPGMPEFYQELGERSEYVFSTSQWQLHSNAAMPGSREFFDLFVKRHHVEPSYFAATAYASGQLLEAAVNQAGSLDRKSVRDMLSEMNASSIVGRYGVDNRGVQIRNFNLIVQVQDGKTEVVWPRNFETKPVVFPHETISGKHK